MKVKKQQLELDLERWTDSELGKEYMKTILPPCLFNLYAEYIMRNAGLDEAQVESRLSGEISITSDTQMLLLLSHVSHVQTFCNPIDSSPPGSSIPGILQARTLEWVAISLSNA